MEDWGLSQAGRELVHRKGEMDSPLYQRGQAVHVVLSHVAGEARCSACSPRRCVCLSGAVAMRSGKGQQRRAADGALSVRVLEGGTMLKIDNQDVQYKCLASCKVTVQLAAGSSLMGELHGASHAHVALAACQDTTPPALPIRCSYVSTSTTEWLHERPAAWRTVLEK